MCSDTEDIKKTASATFRDTQRQNILVVGIILLTLGLGSSGRYDYELVWASGDDSMPC